MPYIGSHAWKVRQKYGSELLLMPAAVVIVERDDGAVLLIKRTDTHIWSTIGGWVEEGHGYRDTAATEALEEGGVKVNPSDLIPIATLSDPKIMSGVYPNGHKFHAFTQVFVARKWEQLTTSLDTSEVLETRFFLSSEIKDDMLALPNREELRVYRDYLKTGQYQSH